MKRVRFVILIVLTVILLFIFGLRSGVVLEDNVITAYDSQNLLRLHVIANSNSLEDQKIKREIRDEIISKTAKMFISLDDPSQAKAVVKANLSNIKQIVLAKLKEHNKDYNVELKLGEFEFPTRSYGGNTLKSGKYQALQVVLGAGAGENWWCVLFPPLCFVDSIDNLSEQDLKKLATKDKLTTKEQLPIEFKFKFIEVLRANPKLVRSKLKLAQILETSFPGLNKLFFSTESDQKPSSR